MPPAPRRLDDLTSSVPASAVNMPPSEAHPNFPRRLRPRRRRKRQPAAAANENSSSLASSTATQPRSTANRNSPIPGNQPGISQPMRSTPVEHPQTFLRPQHSQFPNLRTNKNAERRSRLDHPEIWGYIIRPLLTCSSATPTKPFSGSPSRQHLTDPTREAREAGRQSPGIVYPLPRAARPDTRLVIDAALPEAATLDRRERPPTVVDIPEPGRTAVNHSQGPLQQRGSRSPRRHYSKRPRNRSSGVYRPKKRSPHRDHWCE